MFKNKFSMTKAENECFALGNIIGYTCRISNMEGILLTYSETAKLLEGEPLAKKTVKEVSAVINIRNAWRFMLDNLDCEEDLGFVQKVNSCIGEANVVHNAGELRIVTVKMGGTTWKPEIPAREKTKSFPMNMYKKVVCLDTAMDILLYLMRAQLFEDGNKRTANIVANHYMIRNGLGCITIPQNNQDEFIKLLVSFYETNDDRSIKQFLYDNCIEGMHYPRIVTNKFVRGIYMTFEPGTYEYIANRTFNSAEFLFSVGQYSQSCILSKQACEGLLKAEINLHNPKGNAKDILSVHSLKRLVRYIDEIDLWDYFQELVALEVVCSKTEEPVQDFQDCSDEEAYAGLLATKHLYDRFANYDRFTSHEIDRNFLKILKVDTTSEFK